MRSRTRKTGSAALLLTFIAAAWFFLAPPVLGGSTTYTITTGNSMEPLLHEGDLAVVKERSTYAIGDVVAYDSADLGRTVLHRIIGRDGDSFAFKGDNNDFIDPEHPATDRLIGSMWFHVPKLGTVFAALRSPVGLSASGLVLIFLSSGMFAARRRKRSTARHRIRRGRDGTAPVQLTTVPAGQDTKPGPRRVPPPPPPPRARPDMPRTGPKWTMSHRGRYARWVASIALAAAVLFGTGAFFMGAQPETLNDSSDTRYSHSGTFAYEAPVPNSAAYDGPELRTGEPIFLKVLDDVTVTYAYGFSSEADHEISPDGTLEVVVSAGNGLSRTLPLRAQATRDVNELGLSAPLALDRVRSLVRRVEKETGVDQSSYAVTVVADVRAAGTIAGQPLDDRFGSSMELRFDGLQLSAPLTADGVVAREAFTASETGSITGEELSPNHLAIAGRSLEIGAIERAGWIGAAAAAAVALVALVFLVLSPRDEANRIHAKYGTLIVPIKEAPKAALDVVDVPDIDTLVRLAEQFEQVILHDASRDAHTYLVSHDGFLYRYGLGSAVSGPRAATA